MSRIFKAALAVTFAIGAHVAHADRAFLWKWDNNGRPIADSFNMYRPFTTMVAEDIYLQAQLAPVSFTAPFNFQTGFTTNVGFAEDPAARFSLSGDTLTVLAFVNTGAFGNQFGMYTNRYSIGVESFPVEGGDGHWQMVPTPGSLALILGGAATLGVWRLRRRTASLHQIAN